MFTGLIEELGIISDVKSSGNGLELTVKAERILEQMRIGDSVAINGACQTVTRFDTGSFTVFASIVTVSLTTLGELKKGDCVNLERAVTPTTRLGGHLVQGHVDGKGTVKQITNDESGTVIKIEVPYELTRYIAPKGSIATDGISLTVVSIKKNIFSLYVIPDTISCTTIPDWFVEKAINIEVDILAKYVENFINKDNSDSLQSSNTALKNKLLEEGFM